MELFDNNKLLQEDAHRTKRVVNAFNHSALPQEEPATAFFQKLKKELGSDTAFLILDTFDKLNIPVPQEEKEFLQGESGFLLFLNRYGIVMRIEKIDTQGMFCAPDRINDNAWILSPLASIKTGKAIIEICPGCHQENKKENNEHLRDQLKKQGIDFWDYKFSNIGRMPVKTARFPEGITVVIDRLAVAQLTYSVDDAREALRALVVKRSDPSKTEEVIAAKRAQGKLYGPLKKSLKEGLKDDSGQKMEYFWRLCEQFVRDGKLVAGWNEAQPEDARSEDCAYGDNTKTHSAKRAASHYASRLKSMERQKRFVLSPS